MSIDWHMTFDTQKMLMTGANGLLGGEIKKLLPEALYTNKEDFDITNPQQMEGYLIGKDVGCILHAAAMTSPPKIDKNPAEALQTNIIGTANVALLCLKHGFKLVYMCTDYVFAGDRGNYKEEDPVFPVNKYAWSKLGGECTVRMIDKHLIIRTSFGENVFPYKKAFVDHWTSRQSVSVIARKVVKAMQVGISGTLHIGGNRRSVYEYANDLDPSKEIGKLSVRDVNFVVPADTSLGCSKYQSLIK